MDDIFLKVTPAIVSLVGVFVSHSIYRLSKQQHKDSWLRTFNALHELFWTDKDYQVVRAWIACDKEYQEVASIIEKRLDHPQKTTKEEYEQLEKLDKFFNLFVRAVEVKGFFADQKKLWKALYFQYWIKDIKDKERIQMERYLKRHYKSLVPYLSNIN